MGLPWGRFDGGSVGELESAAKRVVSGSVWMVCTFWGEDSGRDRPFQFSSFARVVRCFFVDGP